MLMILLLSTEVGLKIRKSSHPLRGCSGWFPIAADRSRFCAKTLPGCSPLHLVLHFSMLFPPLSFGDSNAADPNAHNSPAGQSAFLRRVWIYPIKSLDALSLPWVSLTSGGSLKNDRRWAIVDDQGQWVNGKREPRIHQIRCQYPGGDRETLDSVHLEAPGQAAAVFSLENDRSGLAEWLSDYFGKSVHLIENLDQGFPDDTQSPGPTIVTEATLSCVSQWLELSLENVRQRFRANLELGFEPPPFEAPPSEPHPLEPAFWEDRLFGATGEVRSFSIGAVNFVGVNPCLRCVVPTRDPQTGTVYPQFVRQFTQYRRATLPAWVNPDRFENAYRLTVNTRIDPASVGHTLRIGDAVTIG